MLPPQKDISVVGTLNSESTIAMSIDAGAFHHLMDILSNIYSDTELAVVREYITNALDSHVEAGQTLPVEVTTPSRFSPNFIITDYGVGMSPADIENIYAKYGASTKRNTNAQAGSIGIGAKSGLAYSGMFTVRARKGGIECLVIVSVNDQGDGIMDIQYIKDTDEPNGVQISLPVSKNIDQFRKKIHTFHKFVEPGLLIVDGKAAANAVEKITPKMGMFDSFNEPDYVVMGNVFYPIDSYQIERAINNYSVVYYVPMGAVHFTPSREELNYDSHTLTTLKEYRKEFKDNFFTYLQRKIDSCDNIAKAFNMRHELTKSIPYGVNRNHTFTYKGQPIPPSGYQNDEKFNKYSWNEFRAYSNDGAYLYATDSNYVYVTGWTNKRFTRVHGAKVTEYCKRNGLDEFDRGYFTEKIHNPELFTEVTVLAWEDIAKIKFSNGSTGKRGAGRKYEGMGAGEPYGEFIPSSDPKVNLWYGSKDDFGARIGHYQRKIQNLVDDNNQFVFVTDSIKPAFLKKFPHAKHWRTRYDAEAKAACQFTQADRDLYASAQTVRNGSMLIWSEILDPDLKRHEIAYVRNQDFIDLSARIAKAEDALKKCSAKVRGELSKEMPQKVWGDNSEVVAPYPLLASMSVYGTIDKTMKRHMTDYVNSIYKKNQEGN